MDILDKIAVCADDCCGECELDEFRRSHKGEFVVCMGKLLEEAADEIRRLREELNG